MAITKGFRALVDEAVAQVTTYSVAQVRARLTDANTQMVDIRDVRELAEGTVPGAFHAPRGMLEFWVDPASPYHKPVFAEEAKEFILFGGAGWAEWVKQGAPTETLEQHKARRQAKV